MGISLLRTSAGFVIQSGRMAMPNPLRASFRATVGSLETTRKRIFGVTSLLAPAQPPNSGTDAGVTCEVIRSRRIT